MSVDQDKQLEPERPRRVVGLGYEPEHGVPRVMLKALGSTAEDIIWRGQRGSGTPIVKKPAVLDALYRLPVDADSPPERFEVIAVILVHVSAVDAETRQKALQNQWETP